MTTKGGSKRSSGRTKRKSGFTLTELLVAVGVMAVASTFAVYNVRGRAPQYRIEKAQYQLLSDMRNARMEAASKSADCRITFNDSTRTYTIWLDKNRNGSVDSGESTNKTLSASLGVTLSTSPNIGTFKPNGTFTCSGSYQYVQVNSSYGYRIIYVFPSGQVEPYQYSS